MFKKIATIFVCLKIATMFACLRIATTFACLRIATIFACFRCVLNWFGDWSNGALFQVGKEFTNKMDLEKGSVSFVLCAMSTVMSEFVKVDLRLISDSIKIEILLQQ